MTEAWRPVVGYEGCYEVSDLGRVCSLPRVRQDGKQRLPGCILKPRPGSRPRYPRVNLYRDGASRGIEVHSLVAAAFIGPRPEGMEVCHRDGNPTNNALSNLRYGSRSDNYYDSCRHGTAAVGEKHYAAKLTAEQVAQIREKATSGAKLQRELADEYGISQTNVSMIKRGATWRHATLDSEEA